VLFFKKNFAGIALRYLSFLDLIKRYGSETIYNSKAIKK